MSTDNIAGNLVAEHFLHGAKNLRQSIGVDIPIQQIMILTYLWLHGRSNQTELARTLDFKVAAASRHCRSLSAYFVEVGDTAKQKGQMLILAERNQTNSREMVYRLTESTHEIMTKFMQDLAGVYTEESNSE